MVCHEAGVNQQQRPERKRQVQRYCVGRSFAFDRQHESESLVQGQLRNDARGFVPSSRSTPRSETGSESASMSCFAGAVSILFCCKRLQTDAITLHGSYQCTCGAAACPQTAMLVSDSNVSDIRSSKLSLAAVNAAPFVPSNKAKSVKPGGNVSESSKHRPPVSGIVCHMCLSNDWPAR